MSFGFRPGECRFKGATGGKRGYSDFKLALNLVATPNVTGVTIGTITDIEATSHEYISVVTTKQLAAAGTDGRVYETDNWKPSNGRGYC